MATDNYSSKRLTASRPSSIISTLGVDDDLLVEILIRLPGPKSAFRCKSVCRRWNALISAPYFSRRFVSHHQSLSPAAAAAAVEFEQPVLTPSQVRPLISSFLPFPDGTEFEFSVLDSVNDLLLLGFWGKDPTEQELRRTHLVCNPFTKQWVALPLAPKMAVRLSHYRWIVKLVREPFDSSHELPRGFRVVRMYDPMREGAAKVDVYMFCSRSGRWTKSVLRLEPDLRCWTNDHEHHRRVVSTNGKLYWLNDKGGVVKWDPFCQDDYGTRFPMLLEGCKLDSESTCYGPWVSEGAVHIVCRKSSYAVLSVWRLMEEGKGGCWSKLYDFSWSNNLSCRFGSVVLLGYRLYPQNSGIVVGLHPQKSGIVFLLGYRLKDSKPIILSLNFRDREFEFVTHQATDADKMIQPTVPFWPSLIAMLQNPYNGSYDCWIPSRGN
ncbi:unnamed protein product [Linum tenue]|uniref:F-box domain-containing protein n=1 Tax=Linum tenue TaxID=586396 RepID=A0AAV0QSA8_9ROSI|nr:unnamed protein product [Linum tenue]